MSLPAPLRLIGARTLSVFALFAACELGMRYSGGYGMHVIRAQTGDLGWRMVPNQRRWTSDDSARIRINDHGYRGADWGEPVVDERGEPARDPRLLRVAVLGNSMTMGSNLRDEDVWPRVLEELLAGTLRERGDLRAAQVMNFSVEGYVSEQMHRLYDLDVRRFAPDIVVLTFNPRDICPPPPPREDPLFFGRDWIRRTATYDGLDKLVTRPWKRMVGLVESEPAEVSTLHRAVRGNAFHPDLRCLWEDAFQRTKQLHAAVERDGARLLVVGLPQIEDVVHGDRRAEKLWKSWLGAHFAGAPYAPVYVDPLRDFLGAMPDLIEALRPVVRGTYSRSMDEIDPGTRGAEQSLFLLTNPGHYNAAGMRVVAERVHAALLALPARQAPRTAGADPSPRPR